MTRKELESQFSSLFGGFQSRIEASPLRAFAVGIVLGAVLWIFKGTLFPILIVGSVVAWAYWFLSEGA